MGPDEATSRRTWRWHLGWPAVLLAGWLLYECTAQPAIGVIVACAKFGWADVRTAWWLRRIDPDSGRGRACFWWYVTFGLWKVAVTATLAMGLLVYGVAMAGQGQPGKLPPSPVLQGALIAAACGFGLSFFSSYVALWAAWHHGVRIWLGIAPHRARAGRFWPPCHGQTNIAPYVLFTTMIFTISVSVAVLFDILLHCNGNGRDPLKYLVILLIPGTVGATVLVFRSLADHLIARTPQECWPALSSECALQVTDPTA